MRIVIASGIYPPDIGGPATYSQLIAKEFIKKGIEITAICYSDKKQQTMNNEQFRIVRISRKHNILARYWLYFWGLLKLAHNSDIVYAQGPISAGFPSALVSLLTGKKFILKIVGDVAWERYANKFHANFDNIENFQKNKYDFKTELLRKTQKWVCGRASKIIVPSKFLKKIVINWDIDKEKIKIIYNAFKPLKLNVGGSTFNIASDNMSKKQKFILSAGRLMPWKGFDILIKIFKELPKEIVLKIAGTGAEESNLKELVSKLGLEKRVEFLGSIPHNDLLYLMSKAKMFVLSTGYEGFSHIILEAMATNLPVITTNICGNPEIIRNNYNGLLVDYNNKKQLEEAILKLWGNEELQKKFIENGKKSLKKFSKEKIIKETLKILK